MRGLTILDLRRRAEDRWCDGILEPAGSVE